jgi:hypothetical protein
MRTCYQGNITLKNYGVYQKDCHSAYPFYPPGNGNLITITANYQEWVTSHKRIAAQLVGVHAPIQKETEGLTSEQLEEVR